MLCVVPAVTVGTGVAQAAPTTTVALTFDDGNADQMTALPILNKYGMKGTFYIVSGSIGAANYLTRSNLASLASSGMEIGGHTITHPDLTTVPTTEAKRQICNDRATLTSWGYQVRSFAYPYASANATTESLVQQCGYNSARGLGDIASAHGCRGCDRSETLPPEDPYWLKAVDEHDVTWTLAQMQSVVNNAKSVGGLVPFTFHNICAGSGCPELSISPTMLDQFLAWLKVQSGVVVKPIGDAIGGSVKPVVTVPPPNNTSLVNASLESSTTGNGFPDCWSPGGWGTNTPTFTRLSSGAHTGTYAERLTITGYASGDAKLMPTMDTGTCTPSMTPGQTYKIGAWYKSTGITQFALYYRNTAGAWLYWTSSPWFATASAWTQATFTTPAAPADSTGMSFGLALIANGQVTTDDYTFGVNATGGTAAQSSALAVAGTQVTSMTQSAATATAPRASKPTKTAHHHPHKAKPFSTKGAPHVPGAGAVRPGQVIAVPAPPD